MKFLSALMLIVCLTGCDRRAESQRDVLTEIVAFEHDCPSQKVFVKNRPAIEAWGKHTWQDCPMHAAHGVTAPTDMNMAAWVALYDAKLLTCPTVGAP